MSRQAPTPAVAGAGRGSAFGTFGELLQGVLPGSGGHFMVTLPLARWSTAEFSYEPSAPGVRVTPAHKHRAARLAVRALRAAGLGGGGRLRLGGELPEGKGMASSSADLVATARAVADAVGARFGPADVEALLRGVEPTDGVMYDEVVAFGHREVRLRERLGTVPAMTVVGYDEGGTVDTIGRNRTAAAPGAAERREYALLLDRAREAVRAADLPALGRVATRSAELHARRHPRPALPTLLRVCRDVGGLGVACAHSGTVLGILLPHDDPATPAKAAAARSACAAALPGPTRLHRTLGPADDWTGAGVLGTPGQRAAALACAEAT
ncbi:kinase [Streptomyces sp. WAC07149]|uniref:GHMP family kinase ATP-binding protein n=1 Tax=Streptomyces sp. WAC07149 TaxID=2487425 RepID=UPI0021AEB6B7|nr:kinase [Streptomyces sp. WAC07149]